MLAAIAEIIFYELVLREMGGLQQQYLYKYQKYPVLQPKAKRYSVTALLAQAYDFY